jgi:hypothetical protein
LRNALKNKQSSISVLKNHLKGIVGRHWNQEWVVFFFSS